MRSSACRSQIENRHVFPAFARNVIESLVHFHAVCHHEHRHIRGIGVLQAMERLCESHETSRTAIGYTSGRRYVN
jgi:hypothetical protein